MTDNQTSILLKGFINRLERIEQEIIEQLPEEFAKTETRINHFRILKDTPKEYTVTTYPILFELQDFIQDLKDSAEQLKVNAIQSVVKRKV